MSKIGATLDRILARREAFEDTIKKHAELCEASEPTVQPQSSVNVHVKLRPFLSRERELPNFKSVYCHPGRTSLYCPTFQVLTDPGIDVHSFEFDGNHDQDVNHDDFFQKSCQGIVELLGTNSTCAIIAYGQTGSGKTYTMTGVSERLMECLPYETHTIQMQVLEIMGDVIKDLRTKSFLKVLVDPKGKAVLVGNTEYHTIYDSKDGLETLDAAFASRKTRGTLKNDTSSRSHFICRLILVDKINGKQSEVKIVDLAGSERNADTKNHDAERIKEAAYINTSLMSLKECIRNKSADASRIPVRSSKLTLLLKDVLCPEPSVKTHLVIVATLSPSIHDILHSLDTFKYASALKNSIQPAVERPVTAPTAKTPMAWTVSALESWISRESSGKADLKILLGDGMKPKSGAGFVLPPWKSLYELDVEKWIKRSKLNPDEAKNLRLKYRGLFLKARAAPKATSVGGTHQVETIMLVAPEPIPVQMRKTRNELAMEKLAARGAAARKTASTKTSLYGI